MSAIPRPLTPAEIDLARGVFGDAIDYGRARVANAKWAFFQPRHVAMAPTGCIHFHPAGGLYCDDFAHADIDRQGLFVHEMTHIWQTQRRGRWYLPLMRHPFCTYRYVLRPGQPFERYGIEQQAEIVRHAFLTRHGRRVPGAPGLAQYDSILPFRRGGG